MMPRDYRRRVAGLRQRCLAHGLTDNNLRAFRRLVRDFWHDHARDFSWRRQPNPYRVVVSEIMLQQTQTSRVDEKFPAFIEAFPSFAALAAAPLDALLLQWQGLGYNRRALFLQKLAIEVVTRFDGTLPREQAALRSLPGLGPATAASVAAFAFNQPTVFIETNVRSLFIHLFFTAADITDEQLLPLVARTLDRRQPRIWYNALMDLGAWMKRNIANGSLRSRHYVKQSSFEGSVRQVRGAIIRLLVDGVSRTKAQITKQLADSPHEIGPILDTLVAEGFLIRAGNRYSIA